ncbi:S-layer homology domain-containing protein [Crassaminicella profunda]|uniref:S-layer homology domain-containing protein n=1 Tax=Crassaminicella profunda TaxID=1286698 RepID=UPI001CA787F5|nr:S-layer homology domain-containing protein [Crassaminicella profunda]QZY55698.1 S-layer homology domain-containing protein [Crassaminicella profunda]
MIKRKIGSLLLSLLFLLSLTATSFAQIDFKIDVNDGNIKMNGTTENSNKVVVVQINDGKKKVYFDQGLTDGDGKFQFQTQLEANKDYKGYFLTEGEQQDFTFKTEKEEIIIEKKTNVEKIEEVVDGLRKYYENDREEFNFKEAIGYYHTSKDVTSGVATIKSKYKKNSELDYATDYAGNIIGMIASRLNPTTNEDVRILVKAQKPSGLFEIKNESGQSTQTSWSIVALDMAKAEYNEEAALKALINLQDGSGSFGSIDHTAMCMMALEKHKNIDGVTESINRAKKYLLENKKNIIEKKNVYTVATVIQGLVAIGENPLSNTWTVDDKSMLSALLRHMKQKGSFEDRSANEQAFMALADLYKKESMYTKTHIDDTGFNRLFVEQENTQTDPTETDPKVPENKNIITLSIKGYKGTVLSEQQVEIKKGESLWDVTKRLLDRNGKHYNIKTNGYVDSIDGQKEKDKGAYSGWKVKVNGNQIETGVRNYELKGGENIQWYYIIDYRTESDNKPESEIQTQIDAAKNTLDGDNLSESQIKDTVKDVSEKLKEKAEKINSKEDAKAFIKDVKNMSKVMEKAVDKIKSEDGAKDLANQSIDVVKTLIKSAEQVDQKDDKKEISKAAAENMKMTLKAMDKIKSTEAKSIAEDVIESAGSLMKKLGKENAKEIKEKAVEVAKKALKKVSTKRIEKAQMKVDKDKVIAKIGANNLKDLAKMVANVEKDMKEKLKKNDIESDQTFEKKVTIEIFAVDKKEVETNLPKDMMKSLKENGIEKVSIQTEVASFDVTPKTFGEKAIDQEISLSAKTVDKDSLLAIVRNKVPEKSIVVDLTARVGQEKVTRFEEPMTIRVPYEGKVKTGEKVEVFYLKDDGNIESMGGKYDPVTKIVTFKTSHFSKYFAKIIDEETQVVTNKIFIDLGKYEWAKEAIEEMANKGIINGRGENTFDPSANITRAEFATLVTKMMGYTTEDVNLPFTDVTKDAWYYSYVGVAYKNELINGRSDTVFDPNGNITRQEMAVIVAKVLDKAGVEKASLDHLNIFKDTKNIASWAKESVTLCVKEKIISGMGDGNFAPKQNANRAQAATMLYKIYNLMNK